MSLQEHRKNSPETVSVTIAVVSDSKTAGNDVSGKLISELLKEAGHNVVDTVFIKNSETDIEETIKKTSPANALILTGGTGISARDITAETAQRLFSKTIDGFGELFRMLSFNEIGPASIMSRASAGVYRKKVIFCLPGSPKAVKLAMEKIIIPEIGHIVEELEK